jgi:hypothetical protein
MNNETYKEFFHSVNTHKKKYHNDGDLGYNIRSLIRIFENSINIYDRIKKITEIDIDIQCDGTVFRFGHWEIPSDDVVSVLEENNYKISYVADEDRGELFCYMLQK